MRQLFLLLFLCVASPSAFSESPLQQQIRDDIHEYQKLVEQALVYRSETLRVYHQLKSNMEKGIPLSGADMDTLNNGMQQHLTLRKAFYQVVNYYRYLLDSEDPEIDAETRLSGVMLSLSAALVLYDNYLLAISIYEDDTKLRRYLNAQHKGYQIKASQLNKVTIEYNSVENRQQVQRAIKFFEDQWHQQSEEFRQQADNIYLYTLIKQSAPYNSTLHFSPLYIINRHLKFLGGVSSDALASLSKEGINLFSLLFGNSVGLVQTRKGRLYHKAKVENSLSRQLRAGDILLEKTPFRLTDKLIPGYWGHVAIWVGSRQELEALGIWNHPVVRQYHPQILASRQVVEALRSGVEINPLEDFLNIDDLAVIRKKHFSDAERGEVIIRALRQLGKAYDFNFDVETNDRIVCSELIYVSYTDTPWPTQSAMGRYTISPTHIAEKAGTDGPFQVVALYLQGKPVKDNIDEIFEQLSGTQRQVF